MAHRHILVILRGIGWDSHLIMGDIGFLSLAPVDDVEDLRQRIIDAFETIRNTDGIFQRVNESLYRRTEACILANGGHFEQFI